MIYYSLWMKRLWTVVLFICLPTMLLTQENTGQSLPSGTVKAGFIFQFLLFTELPESAFESPDEPLGIGIVGDRDFRNLFIPLEDKLVNGRPIKIKFIERDASLEALTTCHLLFLPTDLGSGIATIIAQLDNFPVITVSDRPGFIESGGMIALIEIDNKIGFEINQQPAAQVGIKFRSKMLRLASNVIGIPDGRP